jgi:MFS family permease
MTPLVASQPPRALLLSVALLTGALLLVELIVTRLFSVLFFYHYSFFAVSLVMSGLSLGGLIAARWNTRSESDEQFHRRLAGLALLFSGATISALAIVAAFPTIDRGQTPATMTVGLLALVFVPGLTAAGAYLAVLFSRRGEWVHRLYAADLLAAGAACVAVIFLMRIVQGPASVLAATALAALAGWVASPKQGRMRFVALALVLISCLGLATNVTGGGRWLSFQLAEQPVMERWNEHSRVLVLEGTDDRRALSFVIDRTASTDMQRIPPRVEGGPIVREEWWDKGTNNLAYRLGRPLERTAVIGVGGGRDLLAALGGGARHVDGYELNGILVDLLKNRFRDINPVASWPEVTLIHSEARIGIQHSGRTYDVIQASLIDTWAATAGGGFVLSENGLYTVEGWRVFIDSLTDGGVLTMTRWHVPSTPAETERLVSLAAQAINEEGIVDPASHVILAADGRAQDIEGLPFLTVTILLSKSPFSGPEVERMKSLCAQEGCTLLAAPGVVPSDHVLGALLDPTVRDRAIRQSPYDISAPTDLRPYFFLQVRPEDVMGLASNTSGMVLDITFRAVVVMMLLAGVSLAFATLVLVLGTVTLPSASTSPRHRSIYRWMTVYFLGIGFGYILVQLGLNQRFVLILGHPTLSLAVVLGSMLLGTGAGSYLSGRLFADGRFLPAWISIVAVLGVTVLLVSPLSILSSVSSSAGRAAGVGLVTSLVGLILGFAFPLGVRLVAPTGEWAVQKMWAINGAASIAGSAAAAIIGLALGSRAVLIAGLGFYILAAFCGYHAMRHASERGEVVPTELGSGRRG